MINILAFVSERRYSLMENMFDLGYQCDNYPVKGIHYHVILIQGRILIRKREICNILKRGNGGAPEMVLILSDRYCQDMRNHRVWLPKIYDVTRIHYLISVVQISARVKVCKLITDSGAKIVESPVMDPWLSLTKEEVYAKYNIPSSLKLCTLFTGNEHTCWDSPSVEQVVLSEKLDVLKTTMISCGYFLTIRRHPKRRNDHDDIYNRCTVLEDDVSAIVDLGIVACSSTVLNCLLINNIKTICIKGPQNDWARQNPFIKTNAIDVQFIDVESITDICVEYISSLKTMYNVKYTPQQYVKFLVKKIDRILYN